MISDSYSDFKGFPQNVGKDYFKYPRVLEFHWKNLSGSEQKILDFCLRQLLGYSKTTDKISLSQFTEGIGKKNRGTGLSISQVRRALCSLERKGFITVKKEFHKTSIISLVYSTQDETNSESKKLLEVDSAIVELIKLFSPVSGHKTASYCKDKAQIKAMTTLVAHYGYEHIKEAILLLPASNKEPYAPSIFSPVELEKKIMSLYAFVQRKKEQRASQGIRISL